MKRLLFLLPLLTLPCFAAITNIQVNGATPREVILRYLAPTPAACTIEVSESATYTPLVNDVNTALFTGSNSDFRNGAQGRDRTFVVGNAGTAAAYAPIDANGRKTSRALQTNTDHYYRLTCGSDTATGSFRTSNIAPGDTFPATTAPIDPTRLGEDAWPFVPWSGNAGIIDPVTGAYAQLLQQLNGYKTSPAGPIGFSVAYDEASTWTTKDNSLVDGTGVASFTGSTNDPLKLVTTSIPYSDRLLGLTLYVKGYVDAGTTTAEACLMIDGATCYGPWIPLPAMPVGAGSIATVQVGDPDINFASPVPPSMLSAWLNTNQNLPGYRDTASRFGQATNVGAALTLQGLNGYSGAFDPRWTANTHIVYGGAYDFGTHAFTGGINYKVASVANGVQMTLNGAPADGSSVLWVAHNYGFMIRKSSAGGTLSIDYAMYTPSLGFGQAATAGSGGTKSCSNARYHTGWRIGGPRGVNTDAATNTSPIVITTTSPFNDLITGSQVKVRGVPGNTAANGTWTITVIDSQHFSLNGSTGNGTFPSDATDNVYYGGPAGGLVWNVSSPTGHFCHTYGSSGDHQLYWINPDTTPATVHYIGPAWTPTLPDDSGQIAQIPAYDEIDPDVPTIYKALINSGVQNIWKGEYMGNHATGMFQDTPRYIVPGNTTATNIWTGTNMTATVSLSTKLTTFDATATGLSVTLLGAPSSGVVVFSALKGIQNTRGWMGVYDMNTNTVRGLMNSWGNSNSRFCGIHTPFAWEGATSYSFVPYELSGIDAEVGPGNYRGPYRMAITSGAVSITPTDCATQLGAIGQANPLGVTGNNCTTITVNTRTPITPATATPANDTLGSIRVGDSLRIYDQASTPWNHPYGFPDNEYLRLVGFSGTTLVVQRAFTGLAIVENFPAQAHAAGSYLHEFCSVTIRWWDYDLAPHGESSADLLSQGISGVVADVPFNDASHYFTRNGFSVNDSGTASGVTGYTCAADSASARYSFRNYPWPNHVKAPASAYGCTQGDPAFDGVHGAGQGNYLEKHPSPVDNVTANPSWTDFRPWNVNSELQQTATKVGTYVFKVTNYGQFQTFDEKRNMLYVMIGHRPGYDVSAAGFILPDTIPYNYTYCYTHLAGECRAGSLVGDVYINAPNVAPTPLGLLNAGEYRCQSKGQNWSDHTMNSLCVAVQSSYTDYAVQYSAIHDPFNTGARRISNAFHYPRSTGEYASFPMLPNGDWGIVDAQSMMLVKVPPYPGPQRGTNRGSWIPIPIKLSSVPAGTNNVVVEFGYNPSFWCSTRQESCVATAATITPAIYNYSTSDTYSGLSCSSGCTPVIPALSQRMMWYRVKYRNGSGSVIKTGEVQTIATP